MAANLTLTTPLQLHHQHLLLPNPQPSLQQHRQHHLRFSSSYSTASLHLRCARNNGVLVVSAAAAASNVAAAVSSEFGEDVMKTLGSVTVFAAGIEKAVKFRNLWDQKKNTALAVSRRSSIAAVLSVCIASKLAAQNAAFAQPSLVFREYIDTFDGYSFNYPANWIPVKGAGADIFFRDPFVLDENLSVDISSPSSSKYKSVEDLGPLEIAAKNTQKQYLTEFMSTRLGVRRESNIISASSNVADDGRIYYQVEVNIKSYANTNELAIMPEERVLRLEWDRRYLSVLGVENNRLYELRLQTPEKVFQEEESDLRRVMDSFRVNKVLV